MPMTMYSNGHSHTEKDRYLLYALCDLLYEILSYSSGCQKLFITTTLIILVLLESDYVQQSRQLTLICFCSLLTY